MNVRRGNNVTEIPEQDTCSQRTCKQLSVKVNESLSQPDMSHMYTPDPNNTKNLTYIV